MLDAVGICTAVSSEPTKAASACVAYTACGSSGYPTFALSINGDLLGCALSNPAVDAATEGVGWAAGEVITAGVENVGFGVSMTGAFEKDISIYSGHGNTATPVSINGNLYVTMGFSVFKSLPDNVKNLLSITGELTLMAELEDGDIANFYEPGSAVQKLQDLDQFTFVATASLKVTLLLSELTDDILANFELPNALTGSLVVSTQQFSSGTTSPGVYLFVEDGVSVGSILMAAISWIIKTVGGFIDLIAGEPPPTTSRNQPNQLLQRHHLKPSLDCTSHRPALDSCSHCPSERR